MLKAMESLKSFYFHRDMHIHTSSYEYICLICFEASHTSLLAIKGAQLRSFLMDIVFRRVGIEFCGYFVYTKTI